MDSEKEVAPKVNTQTTTGENGFSGKDHFVQYIKIG